MPDVPHHSHETDQPGDSRTEAILTSAAPVKLPLPDGLLDRVKEIPREDGSPFRERAEALATARTSVRRTSSPSILGDGLEVRRTGNDFMTPDKERSKMFMARTFVSISAVVMLGLATVMFQAKDSQASLGDVLDDFDQAETLQLKITLDGETADVWVGKSGNLRWQSAAKKSEYLIARGSRLWRIDEASNTASPDDNPWRDQKTQRLDVLALLDVYELRDNLRDARISGTQVVDGVKCHVYSATVRSGEQDLLLEAFADADSRQLRSIACWLPNRPRVGPPIAELKLIARNAPVDEDKFVVGKTLTEDGRIGKVLDRQGVVSLKPLNARRWTPVARSLMVKPGDWIRTARRGANAVSVYLESGHKVTLGPATLIEFTAVDSMRIHSGVVQVASAKQPAKPLNMFGPLGEKKQHIQFDKNNRSIHRVIADGEFQSLKAKPIWLRGFEGTSANESLGSLIANAVDNPNGHEMHQLTIGYHKVSVEIRDQIARTTIEESFVNHTKNRMEGVFHFPLPQDASISGFGMWINNELVEADVVEKQRARQIYEDILRQKEDPALLEWTGGNVFKARVFPIEPHSEKRIRIVYTQVLPLRANKYRYSYGLRSEMLQTTPLRELQLSVTVNSALPLKSVHSPTHTARTQLTPHSARLEFERTEYTPTRDFEIVCEVDAKQSDVVVIPHRRGDNGYFMVQLTPPSPGGNWQRELLPDGKPLELLLVCDTSGSMDSLTRKLQSEFVSAVMSSLGKDDRFNVAVADVDCTWLFNKPVSATDENIERVEQRLTDRPSLGWTDLDRTFASIQKKAGKNSHVIYIGDGVVSAGDADPQAFVARLEKMYDGETRGTFHAVSVGSSFESVVLRAIARLGSGSLRNIDGEQTPQRVALELLNEIAQPGLRDIEIDFRGVQVAAVFPERLPNLAAGTQQVLIGRYLPVSRTGTPARPEHGADGGTGKSARPTNSADAGTGKSARPTNSQSGEIIVTGKRGDETVKYAAKLDFADAEHGNSFIPRLWARAHLDQLLDQGANPLIKDEIIALSEEFHIITPFTSLLVLESDEQRERYGVKRRFQMRDGERFFADGRDNANFELRQQHMKAAGDWRIGLRNQILRHLMRLGRNPRLFQNPSSFASNIEALARQSRAGDELVVVLDETGPVDSARRVNGFAGVSGGAFGAGANGVFGRHGGWASGLDKGLSSLSAELGDMDRIDIGGEFEEDKKLALGPFSSDSPDAAFEAQDYEFEGEESPFAVSGVALRGKRSLDWSDGALLRGEADAAPSRLMRDYVSSGFHSSYQRNDSRGINPSTSIQWLHELFPRVPARPAKQRNEKKSQWPVEAVKISRSLLRGPALAKLKGGLVIERQDFTFKPSWNVETSRSREFRMYSPKRWLQRPSSAASPTILSWADGDVRGVMNASFLLGQTRPSFAEDFVAGDIAPGAYVDSPLHVAFQDYDVEMIRDVVGTVTFRLTRRDYDDGLTRLIDIDTTRNSIKSDRTLNRDGKVTAKTVYSEFVEVGGVHWPTKVEVFNSDGKVVNRTTTSVKLLDTAKYSKRFDAELKTLDDAQLMRHPLPEVSEAESAAAKGEADFEDRMMLMLRAALVQKWDTVLAELAEIEKLTPGKLGIAWMRAAVLASARKNEDARQTWMALGDKLLASKSADLYAARFLIGKVRAISDANETMQVVESLKPIFARQSEHVRGLDYWNGHRQTLFERLHNNAETLRLHKQRIADMPWDAYRRTGYAHFAHRSGEHDLAYAFLRGQIDSDEPWTDSERSNFRRSYYNLLRQDGRSADAVKFMEEWIAIPSASQTDFGRYLTALVFDDRAKDADAIARKWMQDGMRDGELKGRPLHMLNAAVEYATGQRVDHYVYEMSTGFHPDLAKVVEFFHDREHNWNTATNLMWNYRFRDSDECDELRKLFAAQLKAFVGYASSLPNADAGNAKSQAGSVRHEFDSRRADAVINIVNRHDLLTKDEWLAVVDVLLKKRDAAKKDNPRAQFESSVLSIYRAEFRDAKMLPYMRQRIADAVARGDDARAAQYSNELYRELTNRDWSAETEDELFGLIDKLSSHESQASRTATAIASLHQLVDSQIQKRFDADKAKLNDQQHPEQLTRHQLGEKYAEFMKSAREAIAKRLADEAKAYDTGRKPDGAEGRDQNVELAEWCRLERAYLDMQLGRNQKSVSDVAWKTLKSEPLERVAANDDQLDPVELRERRINRMLYSMRVERAVVTLMNLAARKSAAKETVGALLAHFTDRIKANRDDDAGQWKARLYQMLVALDRPADLERHLRQWIAQDENTSHWRRTLARLLAEQGKFDEAIQLIANNERESVLSPSDHSLLAGWHMALNARESYERSRIAALKAVDDWQLQNWINRQLHPWHGYNNQPIPEELDENVIFAFKALFEKSPNPENYVHSMREAYTLTRDFRLLRMVPDSVLGRTPQQVYAFLAEIDDALLREVRKESTTDEILSRIAELKAGELHTKVGRALLPVRRDEQTRLAEQKATTGTGKSARPTVTLSAIDARALDLLECIVETKAAEVANQPGPHADAALAALKRAYKHELAVGEVRQMAWFLDKLGRLKQQSLIDEQVRQLRDLQSKTTPGTDDHIHSSWHLANTIYWQYGERREGMAIMEVAIRAFEQSHPDGWPASAKDPMNGYIGFFEASGQVAAGEKFLKKHIANSLNQGQRHWFMNRLYQLYRYALSTRATVSIGSGSELLKNTVALMLSDLQDEKNDGFTYQVLNFIPDIFDTAHHDNRIATAAETHRHYVFEQLPVALKLLKSNYQNVVSRTATVLANRMGAKVALEFLVDRLENYPDQYQFTYQSGWRNHASTMADYRRKAGPLGDLKPRLLAVVIKELKRDMRSRNSQYRYIYGHYGYQRFWAEKRSDFLKAAEAVLAERPGSVRTGMHVANYIRGDLKDRKRAIEIVFDLHKAGKLDDGQQITLVSWLQQEGRFGETIAILEPLVKKTPDSMSFRVYLIKAYANTNRPNQTGELIADTDKHFRSGGRWTEGNIDSFADCIFDIGRMAGAIKLYNELIPRYHRSQKNGGLGSHQLSQAYRRLSQAYARSGQTIAAMDAASSGMLLWNRTDSTRASCMSNMQDILHTAKDLKNYISDHLDKQAKDTDTDSPILRRMAGVALMGDGEPAAAIEQFQLALELDPMNAAARKALVEALEGGGRGDEAIALRLEQINIERHNLELYIELAEKTKDNDALAERALTSIVESAPTEHTHHRKLAELRQGQKRWDDAIMHWQQVAKLQAFEPTGLLGLAEAQVQAKRWGDARRTVAKLKNENWPSRFLNEVENKTRNVEAQLKGKGS